MQTREDNLQIQTIHQTLRENQLLEKEKRLMGYNLVKESAAEVQVQKKAARVEFIRRKKEIRKKIEELKKQGRKVEEIYKYTSDIIFEEDEESHRYDEEPTIS